MRVRSKMFLLSTVFSGVLTVVSFNVAFAATATTTISASQVTIVNNPDPLMDSVKITGLTAGDVVRIYESYGEMPLGTGTVAAGKTELTMSVKQLEIENNRVQITLTSKGKDESTKTTVEFPKEPQTAGLTSEQVTLTSINAIADGLKVTGVTAGDVVKVYMSGNLANVLGTATVVKGQTEVNVSMAYTGEGLDSVAVTVKKKDKRESVPYTYDYTSLLPVESDKILEENVAIVNNRGKADTITITNLNAGDTVYVYRSIVGSELRPLLGKGKVGSGQNSLTITIPQLEESPSTVFKTNHILISRISEGKYYSYPYATLIPAEPWTAPPVAEDVTFTNNYGIADTVQVTGTTFTDGRGGILWHDPLASGDIVRVYKHDSKTILGQGTVAKDKTDVTVSVRDVGADAGSVDISVQSVGRSESTIFVAEFAAAEKSVKLSDQVAVTNNYGKLDTVEVTNLQAGDIVTVYKTAIDTKPLGTGKVAAKQTSVKVAVPQLGADSGTVYVTVKTTGKPESDKAAFEFAKEPQTSALSAENVTVTNNRVGTSDTIKVTSLSVGDVVKAYKPGTTTVVGTATVAAGKTEVSINVAQLGTIEGSVNLNVTSTGKRESEKLTKSYAAEPAQTSPLAAGVITVTNNKTGTLDTIKVTGLTVGDKIKVYKTTTTPIGEVSVAEGETEATVTVDQLGTAAGSVNVTITSTGKAESTKTTKAYVAEAK